MNKARKKNCVSQKSYSKRREQEIDQWGREFRRLAKRVGEIIKKEEADARNTQE